MILYVISKNRFYFQNWLHVGLGNHWDFVNSSYYAKFYENKNEAEKMCEELNKWYKGWLNDYKGKFRVRTFKFEEIK